MLRLSGIFPSPLDNPLLYVACINIHALSQRLQLDAKHVGLANVIFKPNVQGLCLDDGLQGQLAALWEPTQTGLSVPKWLEVKGGQLSQVGP